MDYEVLLLSRIQEAYRRTGDNTGGRGRGPVEHRRRDHRRGAIMVTVFAAFALADTITIKSIGVGMAIAVFLDATIVRVLLVPATMRLLGSWNWWAPGPLGRFADRLGLQPRRRTRPRSRRGTRQAASPRPAPPRVVPESDVPDLLGPGLRLVLVGINPGRASAAAAAHFANPRNDFWRLLQASGLTPELLGPERQPEVLRYGIGITNAALRTTPGSGDLRAADFAGSAERLERIAARAAAGGDGVRRQGGLPRRVRRATRARPPAEDAGRDAAVRAALDVARQRRRAVGRAPALVQRAGGARRSPRRAVRATLSRGGPTEAR